MYSVQSNKMQLELKNIDIQFKIGKKTLWNDR